MGQLNNWKMTPLDTLLCSNQLQILKSLVMFVPPVHRRQMILMVKLMELKQCLSLPLNALPAAPPPSASEEPGPEIFESITPYCDQEKQQTFRQIQNALQMVKTFRQFSDSGLFDQFSSMMGSSDGSNPMEAFGNMENLMKMASNSVHSSTNRTDSPTGNDQLSSMLSSMMNPEQKELLAQYEAMLDGLG